MTTFSPSNSTSAVAATASDTSSTASSLSYHHLQSASSGSHNYNHHYHPHHQANSARVSSEENSGQVHTVHDAHNHHAYENAASYVNGTEFALCLPPNHGTNPFDMVVSTTSSPSHFNHDPLVRHFLHYRPNDSNFTGNYYSNMSSGSFVNAFDYSYANINPTSAGVLGSEPSIAHPGFAPSLSSQQTHPQSHHPHRSFVHSYLPYQHHSQPILKQTDSYGGPVQPPAPPPLIPQQTQQQQQQQHRQATQQQQNIYPWMKRIHQHCGEWRKSSLCASLRWESPRVR